MTSALERDDGEGETKRPRHRGGADRGPGNASGTDEHERRRERHGEEHERGGPPTRFGGDVARAAAEETERNAQARR